MIPFRTIPANWRVPLFFAELDNSRANTATQVQRSLIVGQITSAGTATPNVPVQLSGDTDAVTKGGAGSMLARMAAKYRANDPSGEVWLLPLADAGGAVAAAGSFSFTHVATAAGVLSLYIAGRLVPQPVTTAQTVNQLATALAALINAVPDMPVIAAVDGTDLFKVNLTAKNGGLVGNDIDIRVNYLGTPGGEATPAGLTYTIVAMSAGATNPTLTTALANCADMPFDFIAFPYTDTTSLNAMKTFLDDQTGRWSFDRQVYGHFFTALRGTVGALTTAGQARNDQHGTIMGFYDSPSMCDEWAAACYGAAAVALRADPGRPLQTVAVSGLLAPPLQSRFAMVDRNTLLFSGISTFNVAPDSTIALENVITTYQLNAAGQPDNSYLEIETMFLLMFVLRALASVITSRFPRMKLAADGTRFAPGSAIVTPTIVKQAIIAQYRELEYNGYVQKADAFAAAIIVEQNSNNPNRLDCLWPGTLIGQLRMFALLGQFRLS
jgi:phage tail sheath gpL-like